MLADALKALHAANLGPMAHALEGWVADARNQKRSHTACVEALVEVLLQHRQDSRTRSFRRRAVLPDHVALATVRADDARGLTAAQLGNLATCDWVRQGHTVVVTGPTQSGKSYLATALAQEAVVQRLTTAYIRVPDWLAECAEAGSRKAVIACIQTLVKPALLVLDDFATEFTTAEESHFLRRLLDERKRRPGKATLIASPTPMEAWDERFEDPIAADAIVGLSSKAFCRICLNV